MVVLVSGATATMRQFDDPRLGYLFVPGAGNSPEIVPYRRAWAADNGAFSDFDAEAFIAMLERLQFRPGCLFVAAPDVVGDAEKTLAKFPRWARVIRAFGLPVALVAQDGLRIADIPWIDLEAVFIGGTTKWKLGREAEAIGQAAKDNRKWLHMGRVNTSRRFRHAIRMGCDSVDGTTFSRWPDKYIPKGLQWIETHQQQPDLEL